jgi:hypothetical protein
VAELPPAAVLERWLPEIREFFYRILWGASVYPHWIGVTSWYRDAEKNRQVGGDPVSQHLIGLGMDLTAEDLDWLRLVMDSAGLIAVEEPRHVHVQLYSASQNPLRR